MVTGLLKLQVEVLNTISLFPSGNFFFFISLVGRLRNQIGGITGAPNEKIVQNHLNIALLNVF